jgi:hypothetical protein
MLVEVLKTFQIYLHQLTPEALIKVGVFIWAMRSQGLEPYAKCFCKIHELSYCWCNIPEKKVDQKLIFAAWMWEKGCVPLDAKSEVI